MFKVVCYWQAFMFQSYVLNHVREQLGEAMNGHEMWISGILQPSNPSDNKNITLISSLIIQIAMLLSFFNPTYMTHQLFLNPT